MLESVLPKEKQLSTPKDGKVYENIGTFLSPFVASLAFFEIREPRKIKGNRIDKSFFRTISKSYTNVVHDLRYNVKEIPQEVEIFLQKCDLFLKEKRKKNIDEHYELTFIDRLSIDYLRIMKKAYSGGKNTYDRFVRQRETKDCNFVNRNTKTDWETIKNYLSLFSCINQKALTVHTKHDSRQSSIELNQAFVSFENFLEQYPRIYVPEEIIDFVFFLKLYFINFQSTASRDENINFYKSTSQHLAKLIGDLEKEPKTQV